MNFIDAVKTCLSKYVNFKGRATRSEYWWFVLFVTIIQGTTIPFSLTIQAIAVAVLALPMLAAGVRRLHDINRSGWWYWICLIPAIGVFILLYWLISEGTQGANDYGNPPA